MIRPLIALLCLATPAWALSEPQRSAKDSHVRVDIYDPTNRTPLVLQRGQWSNVSFGADERIKRAFVGPENGPVSTLDPAKEKNQEPMGNNLPLFGAVVGSTTVVVTTVLANPNGAERPYLFAVKVVEGPKDGEHPDATFQLSFVYPIQERQAVVQKAQATWQETAKTKQQAIAEARLNTDVWYGKLNRDYWVSGKTNTIAPVSAHDNGRLTAFRYPGNMAIPGVLKVEDVYPGKPKICLGERPTKEEREAPEQVVPFRRYDDLLTVEQTAQHFRLRTGPGPLEVLDVWNCAWDPIGANPGTGTTSPDVYRRVITTSSQ